MRVGLDANVLLRALLDDDPIQSPKSREVLLAIDEGNEAYIGLPVLLEVFWVLRSRYKIPRAQMHGMLKALLKTRGLEVESFDAVARALMRYADGVADFPDALLASHNQSRGCKFTYTFDKRAARDVPGMELLL